MTLNVRKNVNCVMLVFIIGLLRIPNSKRRVQLECDHGRVWADTLGWKMRQQKDLMHDSVVDISQ